MPKIDIETAPAGKGTRYPAPHDGPCLERSWRRLGDAAGLTQFGVNLVTLPPGAWSSQRHWHAAEDEFAMILEGEPTLVEDDGESVLKPGDCVGWKAGARNGHCLQNRTAGVVRFLVVGGRSADDWGEYSDIDLAFTRGGVVGGGVYTRKDGSPV